MARSLLACLLALSLPLTACVMDGGAAPTLSVEASLSSVSLADDCPAAGEPGLVAGDCAIGATDCGFCQQTGLQLQLTAAATGDEVPVEIVSVRLLAEDGTLLDTLAARNPRTFAEEGYVAWDETIAEGEELHVAYDTSAPEWSTIATPESRYSARYRVQVILRVDGIERTIELGGVMREAEIVT